MQPRPGGTALELRAQRGSLAGRLGAHLPYVFTAPAGGPKAFQGSERAPFSSCP